MVGDITELVKQCVSHVAPTTIMAIIKTESNYNPYAINLNKGMRLQYQPKTRAQAIKWVEYLDRHGYNFDVGIAQINIKNIKYYGYKAQDLLDPCLNLRIAGDILVNNYTRALSSTNDTQLALRKSISAYNTGNHIAGFKNGYVQKVINNVAP